MIFPHCNIIYINAFIYADFFLIQGSASHISRISVVAIWYYSLNMLYDTKYVNLFPFIFILNMFYDIKYMNLFHLYIFWQQYHILSEGKPKPIRSTDRGIDTKHTAKSPISYSSTINTNTDQSIPDPTNQTQNPNN